MTDRRRQFEALLQEHRGIVFKVAGAYARGREDRSDLAQEIAVQLCGWISLALVLTVVGLARWTGRMRWIADNAAGKAVRKAEAALEEITRFEREA
jgi:DNA-directed RNA polymerase specialized sigma24 family protein